MKETTYHGIYENERKLYTKSFAPGHILFGESILTLDGAEYRHFDQTRSKLAAGVAKKAKQLKIMQGDVVLYLGASHGYTVSFISDIVGEKGIIFAVDNAYKIFRTLFHTSNIRKNIVPIYADASNPASYAKNICAVDVVYQDIGQKEQLEIFNENYNLYAKDGALGILALKTGYADTAAPPEKIAEAVKKSIKLLGFRLLDAKSLDPFGKDHFLFIVTKKN